MTEKGIVVDINTQEHYIIIMKEDFTYLKLNMRSQTRIGQAIHFTDKDLFADRQFKFGRIKAPLRVFSSLVLIIMVLMVGQFGFRGSDKEDIVALIMTVDINPSVKLFINTSDEVIRAEAMNPDANTLDLNKLVGQNATTALANVVDMAITQGFIDEANEIEDYVLVTTVPMHSALRTSKMTVEKLNDKVKDDIAQIHESVPELSSINFALIDASEEELNAADEAHIPLGLYVSGAAKSDINSVKEFFSDNNRVAAFKEKGVIIDGKGKPDDAAKPDDVGKPDDAGKPDDVGKPVEAGKPDDVGKPDDAGKPDGTGKPENTGKPDDVGKPESIGAPGHVGRPPAPGKSADHKRGNGNGNNGK